MNEQRRILYQQKQIETLENQIAELTQTNEKLSSELSAYEERYHQRMENLDEQFQIVEGMKQKYIQLIAELQQIKMDYKKALFDVASFFKECKKDFKKEMKRLYKQT